MSSQAQAADLAPNSLRTVSSETRRKILMVGPRRAGKTSICKVVYESFQPNDTLFLTSTTRTQKFDIDTFQPLQLWDVPGNALMNVTAGSTRRPGAATGAGASSTAPSPSNKGQQSSTSVSTASSNMRSSSPSAANKMEFDIPWTSVCAVVFVVDAQDEYYDALMRLNSVIVAAYMHNPDIHFHVFINKVDGLSDDYKYDTQRDIEQRVYEGLIDSSHELQGMLEDTTRLDKVVSLNFYLTSVFDSSVFVAFSRLQQRLLQGQQSEVKQAAGGVRMVSLSDALETACNLLCTACYFEKAYIFDVPSQTFVGCDTSPFDASLYNIVFNYIHFLRQFSELYATLPNIDETKPCVRTRDWSTSVVRLNHDTTIAFWQLDQHLALLAVINTHVQQHNASVLDYNVGLFRDAIAQLAHLAQS